MRHAPVTVFLLGLAAFTSGCVFPSEARQWNERVGPDGEPVFYVAETKIGLNLLVFVPFMGDMAVDGLIDDLTKHVEEQDGDEVRIVQGTSENYWYGWPPFTWVVTPVISTVAAEFKPSSEEVAKQATLETEGVHEPRWYKPWSW